jgi:hypothetical protein
MPKLIGHRPAPADRPSTEAPQDTPQVYLTWRQAERVRAHGGTIFYELNRSDRGGPGRLAKRWYDWSATPADVLASDPTPSMRRRVALYLARPIVLLAEAIADAARLADARATLERRCAAAAEHARPTCIRVVPGPEYSWRLDRPLVAVEHLHDCAGAMSFDLPDDITAASERVRTMQEAHDRVYHPTAD